MLEQAKFSKTSFPNRALSEADRDVSCQLYDVLVMLLRGRPLDITYNTGLGEGLEAYRRVSLCGGPYHFAIEQVW